VTFCRYSDSGVWGVERTTWACERAISPVRVVDRDVTSSGVTGMSVSEEPKVIVDR
jgi:hypothetical protein